MKGSLTIKEEKMTAKKKYKIIIPKDRCKGCGLCVHVCKNKVLGMSKKKTNKHGYFFAKRVKFKNCTGCVNCAVICPDTLVEIYEYE